MKRIYLDHAAATPLDPRVVSAMEPYWSEVFANPSAIYAEGVSARKAVEGARTRIANVLHSHADEIIFVGSATESLNMALSGTVRAWRKLHVGRIPHVIVSEIEHAAVLETASTLEKEGVRITRVPVDQQGLVSPGEVKAAITEDTVLVSIMYANNEIGTIQPIMDIAKFIRKWKKEFRNVTRDEKSVGDARYPLFHTDACQAANYLSLEIPSLGVDLLTLNAAKIYGPKGVGLLYVARTTPFAPIIVGGGHEYGMRAGTENVPLIIGFAKALLLVRDILDEEVSRLSHIRDHVAQSLRETFPGIVINGSMTDRLPNNLNFSFPAADHEFIVLALDARGFAVSTKSACNELDAETSHVLLALRKVAQNDAPASGIRLSFGKETRKEDLDLFIQTLREIKKTMLLDL